MPASLPSAPLDILILSNGPGELSTWVRPMLQALRQRLGEDREQVRISLVLSPCPNASGGEGAIAARYPELDRIQTAEQFWPFLLWGKTVEDWDWRDRGLVLFLGGDQFFPVVIGKRLGYKTVIYAEWEARWPRLIDGFGVRREEARNAIPTQFRHKCTVVGDLMVETTVSASGPDVGVAAGSSEAELVGLLAGSKAAKLTQGVPFMLIIAEELHRQRPQSRCFIPVAPSLDLESLAEYAQPQHNPMVEVFGSPSTTLVKAEESDSGSAYLQVASGARVELYTDFPAYDRLAQSSLCITTVGANTAELGALAVPMIVILPTQQLDAMRAWNGLPGLLANLPGLGSSFAKIINWYMLRHLGFLAWPNVWADEMIVPELIGRLDPRETSQSIINDYLSQPDRLLEMKQQLEAVRGETGAALRLTELVTQLLGTSQE